MVPQLAALTYGCSSTGYPDVCVNTMCYFKYPKQTSVFQLTYDNAKANRKKFSLSVLPTAKGLDHDEVPMNKVCSPTWSAANCG